MRLLLALLNQFRFERSDFKETDFLQPGQIIELGRVPSRIDLLSSISGVSANEAFAEQDLRDTRRPFPSSFGKDALIRDTRAVGRSQDLADLAALEEGPDG